MLASWLGILVAGYAASRAGSELLQTLLEQAQAGRWGAVALHLLFCAIVTAQLYGGFVYLVTRGLHYRRRSRHDRAAASDLEAILDRDSHPLLTILVPSYKEEPPVVLRTLLAAALQTWPNRRVVLLIDDPPSPRDPDERAALEQTRAIVGRVAALLREPREWSEACAPGEPQQVAALLRRVAAWFADLASHFHHRNHEESFFVKSVLDAHAEDCRHRAAAIETAGGVDASSLALSSSRFVTRLFSADISGFERKSWENLAHEPNKAMNLNAYIGLIGGSFGVDERRGKRHLVPATGAATLQVPDSPFLITLDADSVIATDYALRLFAVMDAPGNERMAVAQTPYSAFPGAPGLLERLAGATTDIQYIIHQGFTACSGTYWVGANALLRKAALDDIATRDVERGHPITRYIQDRTVIEDTESSIDLVARGWSLFNYPERLAHSATPPDFGSLLIQRRRWANGGLIILPKLLRYLAATAWKPRTWAEAFVRIHYLLSITTVNIGLLVVLAVPFTESIQSWWLPVTAVPYFLLYARDLKLSGYRYGDMLGVYALNLLLIPVHLAGVFKSIHQMWTGHKSAFARTPKVNGRTAVGAPYIVAVYALILQWLVAGGVDLWAGRTVHGCFALLNASFLGYAAVRLVGLAESWQDAKVLLLRSDRQARRQRRSQTASTTVATLRKRWEQR